MSEAFEFFDPGELVDGDLELVVPQQRYVDDLLAAARHPTSLAEVPEPYRLTHKSVEDFLAAAPLGHYSGKSVRWHSPAYHFWMKLASLPGFSIVGSIGLRIGDNENLNRYVGHVGYNVYPPARGRHLAERSVRLLLPLARRHGMRQLWITTNPENAASQRTCQRLGATLVDVVDLPADHELYQRGERRKCRYLLVL